jgi:hypothetical protein
MESHQKRSSGSQKEKKIQDDFSHKRVQTAEGWKRDQEKKLKSSKKR